MQEIGIQDTRRQSTAGHKARTHSQSHGEHMRQKREVRDEAAIGTKGSGPLQAHVQVDGKSRSFSTTCSADAAPGSTIRVSIRCGPNKGRRVGKVARVLAFIDPLTGKLIVRMGMFDVSRSTRGAEDGPQVVWDSDGPVCDVDTDRD